MSEATRVMCLGTYRDEAFAAEVLRQQEMEDFQAVAPSYGVDTRFVQHHARIASGTVRPRDTVVALSWLLALVLCLPAAVAWLLALKGRQLLLPPPSADASGGTRTREAGGLGMQSWRRLSVPQVQTPARKVQLAVVGWVALVLAVTTVTDSFGELSVVPALPVVLVLLLAVPWAAAWWQQQEIWRRTEPLRASRTTTAALAPAPPAQRAEGTVSQSSAADRPLENVVIYSGFRPFVGSGQEIHSWALELRLLPGQGIDGSPLETTRFDAEELLDALRAGLRRLGEAPTALPDLTIGEQVFVDGRELQAPAPFPDGTFLGGGHGASHRPVTGVSEDVVATTRGRIEGPVRHCLTVQTRAWSGDIVLTAHVQAALTAHTLHLYCTASVLPPVHEAYREADRINATTDVDRQLRIAAAASTAAADALARPLHRLVQHVFAPYVLDRRKRQLRRAIAYDSKFDFGAVRSLRELAASRDYANYFQRTDVRRFTSQIELRVVSVLSALLTRHGLDTGELEESRKVLLNNGIIMTGGAMNGAVAAGTGAQATSGGHGGGRSGGAGTMTSAPTGRS